MKNPPEPALMRFLLIALILLAAVSGAARARQVDTPEEYASELSAVLSSGDNTALATFVLDNPELSRQAVDAYRAEAENDPDNAESLLMLADYIEKILNEGVNDAPPRLSLMQCQSLRDKADKAWNDADYALALESYQYALSCFNDLADPDYALDIIEAMNSVGRARAALGNARAAMDEYSRALDVSLELFGRTHPAAAACFNNIGMAYDSLGDYENALSYLHKALNIHLTVYGNAHDSVAANYDNLGLVSLRIGDTDAAMDYFQKSLDVRKRLNGLKTAGAANVYNNLGWLEASLGDNDKALEYYRASLDISRAIWGGDHPETVYALNNIGAAQFASGDYGAARESFEQALDIVSRAFGDGHFLAAATRVNLGRTLTAMDDPEAALEYFTAALKTLCGSGEPPDADACTPGGDTVSALWQTARARYLAGDYELAVHLFEQAAAVLDRLRGGVESRAAKTLCAERFYDLFPRGIEAYVALYNETGDESLLDKAWQFGERVLGRVFLEMIGRSRAVVDGGLPADVIETGEALRARWQAARDAADAFENRPVTRGRDSLERSAAYQALDMAEAALRDYEQQLLVDYPQYAELMSPQPRALDAVRDAVLRPGETALSFFLGPDVSFVFAVNEDSVAVAELPPANKIENMVEAFVARLSSPVDVGRDRLMDRAGEMYTLLLKPVEDAFADSGRLLIVPTGKLFFLPFEALVTEFDDGPDYLVAGYEIRYAPSMNVLYLTAERRDQRGDIWNDTAPWLGFGDPVYSPTDGRTRGVYSEETESMVNTYTRAMSDGDERAFPWDRLPGTGAEIRAIAELFGLDENDENVNLGENATEDRFKELAPEGSRYVHVASHGTLGEGGAGQPAVVLSLVRDKPSDEDGFLTMTEILNMSVPAGMVALSACKTGQGRMEKGEGVAGLSRAFLYSGADSLTVSLWSVADNPTKDLMVRFYDYLMQGMDKADALRRAKLDLIAEDLPPYNWAPFILVGLD